eukprot:3650365-Amphidinium_carterae.1
MALELKLKTIGCSTPPDGGHQEQRRQQQQQLHGSSECTGEGKGQCFSPLFESVLSPQMPGATRRSGRGRAGSSVCATGASGFGGAGLAGAALAGATLDGASSYPRHQPRVHHRRTIEK